MDAINGLSSDPDKIYSGCSHYSLGQWKTQQLAAVGTTGGLSAAIPVAHFATMPADIVFIGNRIGVSSYGTGAIRGRESGLGNILEREDIGGVLAYWTHDDDFVNKMNAAAGGTVSAHVATTLGYKTGMKLAAKKLAPKISTVMLSSAGYLIGGKIGGKIGSKIGAKMGTKVAAKGLGGLLPFVGVAVSAGVNIWVIEGILEAADRFYLDKIEVMRRFNDGSMQVA